MKNCVKLFFCDRGEQLNFPFSVFDSSAEAERLETLNISADKKQKKQEYKINMLMNLYRNNVFLLARKPPDNTPHIISWHPEKSRHQELYVLS